MKNFETHFFRIEKTRIKFKILLFYIYFPRSPEKSYSMKIVDFCFIFIFIEFYVSQCVLNSIVFDIILKFIENKKKNTKTLCSLSLFFDLRLQVHINSEKIFSQTIKWYLWCVQFDFEEWTNLISSNGIIFYMNIQLNACMRWLFHF